MVWSNKFTSPATWPLNLICAIASFRLVERAIPTWDVLAVQMLKKKPRSHWGRWGGFRFQSQVFGVLTVPHISPRFLGAFWHFWNRETLTSCSCIHCMRYSFLPFDLGGMRVLFWGAAGLGSLSVVEGKVEGKAAKCHRFTWNLEMVNWKFHWVMLNGSCFFPEWR